jgi:sugar lactone lactonase YvrE
MKTQLAKAIALIVSSFCPVVCSGQPEFLYLGDDSSPGFLYQYSLPLTAASLPNLAIPANNIDAVAADAQGHLVAGSYDGNVYYFDGASSSSSSPTAVFKNGVTNGIVALALSNAGEIWITDEESKLNGFVAPYTDGSTPLLFIDGGAGNGYIGIAIDSAGLIYVSNPDIGTASNCTGGAYQCSNLSVFAPPYDGPPIVTPNIADDGLRKIALSPTQLFVASIGIGAGCVYVYDLPITATSVPAFSLKTGVNFPESVAVDSQGNLYVGNLNDATVTVFNAPVTSASLPSLIIHGAARALYAMAIGSSDRIFQSSFE